MSKVRAKQINEFENVGYESTPIDGQYLVWDTATQKYKLQNTPVGTSGTSGTSGVNGIGGVDGNDGSSGTSGISGIDGLPGDPGTSGTSGTSGVNGIDGGSFGRNYYFNKSVFEINGLNQIGITPTSAAESPTTVIVPNNSTDIGYGNGIQLIDTYTSEPFDFTVIPGGVQRFFLWVSKETINDHIEVYVELSVTTNDGTILVITGESQPINVEWDNSNTTPVLLETEYNIPNISGRFRSKNAS